MRLIGGICAGLFAGAALAAPPVPLKDFARHDEFRDAKISPAGDHLAVVMLVDGQAALGILDLRTRKVSGQMRFPKGNEVLDFTWTGPTRVVASVARSFGPLDQPAQTGELYGIEADGSKPTYLYGYRGADQTSGAARGVRAEYGWAFVFNPLVDDPAGALVTVYTQADARGIKAPSIERLDTYTGKRTMLALLPGYAPVQAAADRAGAVRFAVTADANGKPQLYAREEKSWREVAHPGGAADEVTLHGAADDGSAVFLTSDEAGGRQCVREYRVDSGKLVERLCADSGAVGHAIFGLDDRLIGVAREDGKPELQVLEAQHPDAVLLRSLVKAFGGQRVRLTSRTDDGRRLVAVVDSDRNPGEVYLVERDPLKVTYLLGRRAWIDPKAMAPSEAITYRTRDGATIHGFLTAQEGLATRKAPLVIMPHGGPHGPRDFWEWHPWAQAFASRGYAVLRVNFRGSGGYGRAHEVAGYRKWGTLMQDDLTDAVRWAIGQGIADAGRVCIMGGSYGGYAALMSPLREPDLYRCAIGVAGVYDLISLSEESDVADSQFGRTFLQKVLGGEEQMREHSPVTYVEKLRIPVLIAHGTADARAPFTQAKILRKALEAHDKPYEWLEYKGEAHGFYKEANHEDFLKKSIEFLDKHIGAGAKPAAAAQTQ